MFEKFKLSVIIKYINITLYFGLLAQLVEQLTLNQRVVGSIPSQPIQNHKDTNLCGFYFELLLMFLHILTSIFFHRNRNTIHIFIKLILHRIVQYFTIRFRKFTLSKRFQTSK